MTMFSDNPRDAGQEAMATLYRQWYNATVAGLRLDATTFQLLQPNSPLAATSDQLWEYYNAVPPPSLVCNLSVSGLNQLYTDYRAVISVLHSPIGEQFRDDLGDADHDAWMAYLSGLDPLPAPAKLPGVFYAWAVIHAPRVAEVGRSDLVAMRDDPVALARQAVGNQSGFMHGVPNFTKTIEDLRETSKRAAPGGYKFDSATQSADTARSWSAGRIGGFWDFFEAGGTGDWAQIQAKAAGSRLTGTVRYEHLLTLTAAPAAWYSQAALAIAHGRRDATLWKQGATPNWNSTFGPNGNMQRFLVSLVVADGIDVTMHSAAEYTDREQAEITTHADLGFFPLFSAKGEGGYQRQIRFSGTGELQMQATSPVGHPVVIGGNVLPAAAALRLP